MNAGDPGPPFKYLYVHPTAKSTSNSFKFVSIAPAECAKSKITRDPFCFAAFMIFLASYRRPVL